MTDKNLYIGIDLGTTNSVMAFGTIDPRTGQITPRTVQIPMQDKQGGRSRQELVPSAVYFKEDTAPIVGEYAKFVGATRQRRRSILSVKSQMGQPTALEVDGRPLSPEEVSAIILDFLAKAAGSTLGFVPKDVIITVPASFDSDMREATLRAAQLAGFRISHEDGSPRDILLDEPRAALYDFINRQERGEIPETVIDLNKTRRVMVFDLGGGTLDISLHAVGKSADGTRIDIEDLAISRYTQLGGDDFDQAVAHHLLTEFTGEIDLEFDRLDEVQQGELKAKMRAYAEEVKIELSNEAENRRLNGLSLDDLEMELIKGQVHDTRSFEYVMRLEEYRRIIRPLMGHGLTLADAHRIDEFSTPDQTDNIIYPILDVLRKAQEKTGSLHVDAVLLNGGMTKSPVIQERLEEFFGFAPLQAADPDKAVARGAVVHHFNLARGIRPASILPDTISVGIAGGFVAPLAQAGTVLPYSSSVFSDFAVPRDGVAYIDMPFFTGRGKSQQAPNRKLATRRIKFPRPLAEGSGISLQVHVNHAGIMTLDGWLTADKEVRFTVDLATTGEEPEPVMAPIKMPIRSSKTVPVPPSGPEEPVASLSEEYRTLLGRCRHGQFSVDSGLRKRMEQIQDRILKASNVEKFVPRLVEICEQARYEDGKARAILFLGKVAEKCVSKVARQEICLAAMRLSDKQRIRMIPNADYYLKNVALFALVTIGRSGDASLAESHVIQWVRQPETPSLRQTALVALGKVGETANAIQALRAQLADTNQPDRTYARWALGRIGGRDRQPPVAIQHLTDAYQELLRILPGENHAEALRYGIYALAELGDQRPGAHDLMARHLADKGIAFLESGKTKAGLNFGPAGRQDLQTLVTVALIMLRGQMLSQADEEVLLTLRTQLAAAG